MSYNVRISNNKYETLVRPNQIIDLTLIESVGNFLPMFSLTFQDTDIEKLDYLNELNPITIAYEINNELVTNQFIVKPKTPVFGNDGYTCSIGGYLNTFDYFKGVPKVPYINGTSVEAITQIANAYFPSTDIGNITTEDKMVWLHNGMNARNFVQDIWKHMYSPNSFPMIGIGLNGSFKLKDLSQLISQQPKYSFCSGYKEDFQTYVSASISDNTSGTTNMTGYTSSRDILIENSLETVNSTVSPEVIMNTSNQVNEAPMPVRNLAPMFQSSNVHPNWYSAYHQNIVRWGALNNNNLFMSLYNNLLPLDIMDLIYVEFPKAQDLIQSADGNFIISRKEFHFDNMGNCATMYIGIREVTQNTNLATGTKKQEVRTYRI